MADLGYDSGFLDTPLAPPRAPDEPANPELELAYTHFTVRMHPIRKLAAWVAWNIDGLTLFPGESISRSGERFTIDPRLPEERQTGEDVYAGNDLDRGHIARRSDLLWGSTLAEAKQANSDSFYFPNITPQHQDFNQSGRGGVWGLLENAVLAQEGLDDRRLTLFGGPVLAENDPVYRGIVQLPIEYWKVVVYRMDTQVRFNAFILTQDLGNLGDLGARRMPDFLEDFDTYLVPLDLLEDRTGLTFASLRELATRDQRRPAAPQMVVDAEGISW